MSSRVLHEELIQRPWTPDEAFAYCSRLAEEHYENFPVGSRFVLKSLRPYVHSIYAFARIADDFADEPHYPDNLRLALLENWEGQLLQCLWRPPQHPVFIALRETMNRFDLPVTLFRDLLTAFRMDVETRRHPRFEDLLAYCRFSANPIGRLVLLLFGYPDPECQRLSDSICTALQLTNFWQDVVVDFEKDRIYLPQEDMARFGYSEADLKGRRLNDSFRALMRRQIHQTREFYRAGAPLLTKVRGGIRFELHLTYHGGIAILDRIERMDFDVFSDRPHLTLSDKWGLVARTALRTFLDRNDRPRSS